MEKSIIHPDYDETFVDNDIALLKFSTNDADDVFGDSIFASGRKTRKRQRGKFKSSASYSPACLPEQGEELPVNSKDTTCMIMGWGKRKETDAYGNDVLHEAKVII